MSTAQSITQAYGGDWHGSYGLIPSPGHSAKDRGTRVSDKADAPDGILFQSFNGGDWRALKDECRSRGLLPEWQPERDGKQPIGGGRSRDVGAWEYTDAEGVVLYRKVRMSLLSGGKSYRFEHPDGRGGWKPKRGNAPQVPYRLPDLIAAPADAVIYMAEGEKQADKLASWGFVATSSKDWRSFEFSGYVRGRTVIILPDNDDEGARTATAAKESVERAEGKAVLLDLPGLPHKGDVMDWTGTADELRALTDAALNPPVETFEIADLGLWARTMPTPKAFVMAPYIPREDVVIVTGDGGTNKSTLALQISACAAAGKQMLGMDVAPGPALYVTAEDDNRENHWRLSKIAHAIGTTLDQLAGQLHIVSLRGRLNNELATFEHDGKLRIAPAYKLLRATIEQTGAKLVTLDNVAHLFAGNENDRSQVTAFINLLYQICGDLGCTILLIAHRNKSGDSYSGSTAWLNAVRSQVLLERVEDDPDVRRLSLGKANYARQGEETMFRWHDFALVRDEDLGPGVAAEIAAVAADNAANSRFLTCLTAATEAQRAVSHVRGTNYAPKIFAGMTEAAGMRERDFERAMERLLHLRQIRLDQPLWRGSNRVMKHGIKAASDCTNPPAQTPRTDPHAPTSQVPANTAPTLHASTPYVLHTPGAAPEGARPVFQEEVNTGGLRVGRPVFPAPTDLSGDDPEDPEDPANFILGRL